jgi:hypothetical protein
MGRGEFLELLRPGLVLCLHISMCALEDRFFFVSSLKDTREKAEAAWHNPLY